MESMSKSRHNQSFPRHEQNLEEMQGKKRNTRACDVSKYDELESIQMATHIFFESINKLHEVIKESSPCSNRDEVKTD